MAIRGSLSRALRFSLLASTCGLAACAVSPSPFSDADLSQRAESNLARVTQDQEPVSKTIDLYEAMARALKYNLDHQVEIAEQALRERELDLAHYSMLPNVVAGSGYNARNKVAASSSENALTGVQSLAVSTSQDQRLRTADVAFSWNILDFGLSYVRARQAADKALIQNELRRKIALRVLEDVRAAYWRAVSAQRLLGRITQVEAEAKAAEREAKSQATDRETSAITALTYQREIIEVQRTLGELRRELDTAMTQLGTLMSIRPGTTFRIATGQIATPPPPAGDMNALIHMAVTNRPELREAEYRKRINTQEAHAALLEILPGAQIFAGANYDSNSYLLHNHWVGWGAKASWNLMKVFSYGARREVVEQQDEMLDKRALAVTMAIMTQVHVSRARYAGALRDYQTAQRYRDVQVSLLKQLRQESSAGRIARQTLVREELNAVVAEAKLDIAYAATQSAYANLQTSLGRDPNGAADSQSLSIAALTAALRTRPQSVAVASQ